MPPAEFLVIHEPEMLVHHGEDSRNPIIKLRDVVMWAIKEKLENTGPGRGGIPMLSVWHPSHLCGLPSHLLLLYVKTREASP